jgi:DNA-binding response OmpR family regulator
MAPIKIISEDQELARIEPQELMHVLVVEDELEVRQRIQRRLTEAGYSVDSFRTPREAAEKLKPNEYQLVIMDIRFDAPNISGDEFIYKNEDAFANSRVVAFTGYEKDIVHDQVFDQIFLKGQQRNQLYDYAETVYRDRQKEVASDIQTKLSGGSGSKDTAESRMMAESKSELLHVLNETRDKETKLVWYKGRDFSANELIKEVEDENSAVGRSHIRMMFDRLRRKENR